MAKRLTTAQFVVRADVVHNGTFDYSEVEYAGNNSKVKIICSEHGAFWQRAADHMAGRGCAKCGAASSASMRSHNTSRFIADAFKVHGGTYDYSKVVYKNSNTKVYISCKEHGDFLQYPADHIHAKHGCPKCNGSFRKTTQEFIQEAREVHGDKYSYELVAYKHNKHPVDITCPTHGSFLQTPIAHINKRRGCPVCGRSDSNIFSRFYDKPTLLYYIKINVDGIAYWKIGITINTVAVRFPKTLDYSVVYTKRFDTGKEAYGEEQRILHKYSKYRYKGPKVITDGSTELFTKNILLLPITYKQGGVG